MSAKIADCRRGILYKQEFSSHNNEYLSEEMNVL
jgi:hypothetical protein